MMNILNTKSLTVRAVYEDDTTFSRLAISAIYKELTDYGFTCETDDTYSYLYIGWNGKRRFYLQSKSSTSSISLRLAKAYANGTTNWGRTEDFGSIDSTSQVEQSFSFTIKFFAIGDVALFALNDYTFMSIPVYRLDGVETIMNTDGEFASPVSFYETDMDNNWSTYFPNFNHPSEPSQCCITDLIIFSHNNLVEYIAKDIYVITYSAWSPVGQLITVDGAKHVNLFNNVFYKIPTSEIANLK